MQLEAEVLSHVDDLDWQVVGESFVENLLPEHFCQDYGGYLAEVEAVFVELRQKTQEHV